MLDRTGATIAALTSPGRLWSRAEVLSRPSPVPLAAGLYAWFFNELPPGPDAEGCTRHGEETLMYVGISPKAPPANGRAASKQRLRQRISYHYRGNAYGSTLRLTLGCLLSERLGIQLLRVGSGLRLTFGETGEQRLSAWMAQNAFVHWVVDDHPWEVESGVIQSLNLPLNIQHNSQNAYCSSLRLARDQARKMARSGPVTGTTSRSSEREPE